MQKIRRVKTGEGEPQRYTFFCPGCKSYHWFNDAWEFNKDMEKPTISPSILVRNLMGTSFETRCHSFIKEGKIQFLNDCDHELKGQTIELPDS